MKWWNTNRNNKNLMWKRGMKKIVNRRNYVCVIKLFSPLCILVLADWSRRTRHGVKIFSNLHLNYFNTKIQDTFLCTIKWWKIRTLIAKVKPAAFMIGIPVWILTKISEKKFLLEFLQNSATISFTEEIQMSKVEKKIGYKLQ